MLFAVCLGWGVKGGQWHINILFHRHIGETSTQSMDGGVPIPILQIRKPRPLIQKVSHAQEIEIIKSVVNVPYTWLVPCHTTKGAKLGFEGSLQLSMLLSSQAQANTAPPMLLSLPEPPTAHMSLRSPCTKDGEQAPPSAPALQARGSRALA